VDRIPECSIPESEQYREEIHREECPIENKEDEICDNKHHIGDIVHIPDIARDLCHHPSEESESEKTRCEIYQIIEYEIDDRRVDLEYVDIEKYSRDHPTE
jgi:hypothetical protein